MPIHNEDIAAIFDEIADLLELQEANPFRVRAYRNAARNIRGMGDLAALLAQGKDLTELPGIGEDLAQKIAEILATGSCKALKELHRKVPAGLEDLLALPGLGPKRVRTLYTELEVKTLKQLEKAAHAGRVRALAGFGTKTEQNILDAIGAHRETERRFLWPVAAEYAEPLLEYLRGGPGVERAVAAGSYRRGRETVGDLDILAIAARGKPVMAHFTAYDEVETVVSQGETRSTVILRSGLQVDLRVVPKESFGAALHYFTGSKAHNIRVRRLGQQAGVKINEYGVFKGKRRVAGDTEESVFRAVKLPFIAPELREDRGEIEAAHKKRLPKLIERADLKGDLHTHSLATDGHADIEAMARAARDAGLSYMAVTDHSRRLTMVHGLDVKRLRKQLEEVDALNARLKGITVLKGIEVDILEDGSLDLPDEVLAELDLVVGAVHGQFNLSRAKQTARILRAMDHRCFSILAHPSGRLLEERAACDLDMERIIGHARERGCFLELNSQPQRLDLTDIHCQMARAEGVLVSINSDGHRVEDFGLLRRGVNQARRGWLEAADVLNTRPLGRLRKLLKSTMG